MLDYLPELLKGLHTSLTLTVASIIVALILSLIFTIILTLKTPGLVDSARLHHPVYRYAAAGADLPDLLRPRTVSFAAGLSVAVASYL